MDYKRLFKKLDEKLEENNLTLKVHCVGGFVLEYYGLKATEDIDAFYESSDRIESLIKEVGEESHVGTEKESWLNNIVSNLMSMTNAKDDKVIFSGSNLTVSISSLESVLIDKLVSGRDKDIYDIAKIMKSLGITKPDRLIKLLDESGELTSPAIVLEAYGEDALADYLRENPKLRSLL